MIAGALAGHRIALLAGIVVGAAALIIPVAASPGVHFGGCPEEARHSGLRVASGTDVSFGAQRRVLIGEWNDQNPDVPATLVEISGSADLQRSQMAAAQQSHSCEYDVLALDTPLTAEFAEAGAITPYPLPRDWATDFLPVLRQSVTWKGTVYALPFNADVGLLYSAKDKPAAPADLRSLLAGNSPYSAQYADYEGATVNALELIWGFGGQVVTGDRVVIDQPANRRATDAALAAMRAAIGRAVPESLRSATETTSIQDFAGGQATFMRNWPYAFRVLAIDPRMRGAGGLRFSVSPLPGPTVLGGQNLAISAYSQRKDQAARLIEFLTGAHAQNLLFGCGGFAPVRTSVYDAPRLCPETGDKSAPEIDGAELKRLADQIRQALGAARLRPVTPAYQDFSEVFRGCLRAAIFGATEIDYTRFARLLRDALAGEAPHAGGTRPCG